MFELLIGEMRSSLENVKTMDFETALLGDLTMFEILVRFRAREELCLDALTT
jgi:hypothetical protein